MSANSSLVQAAVADDSGRDVYRLYGVSNAGSLLGLLAYPFLFEPFVALRTQWIGFGVGIALYAVLLTVLLLKAKGVPAVAEKAADDAGQGTERPKAGPSAILWFLLPGLSTFLLDGLTAHVTLDIMPMPMIRTLVLAIFLLSYMVGFTSWAERHTKVLGFVALVLFCLLCWLNGKTVRDVSLKFTIAAYLLFLLSACTFLHGWLYRIRPATALLTRYYLANAIGGAVGGILASLVAPLVFTGVTEYPVALFATGLLALLFCATKARRLAVAPGSVAAVLLVAGAVLYVRGFGKETRPVVYRGRGFFGTIEVLESKARVRAGEGYVREFVHGTTVHGIQALLPGRERMATTYYTPQSSGFAIRAHPKYRSGEPMRVNVTGLGIGVLFCYGRTNDTYRAYEISQEALDVATDPNLFTFVSGCPAKKEIVLGDARKGLEEELARGVEPYDVIIVDAFTGDNLPYHLSTKEAFDLYFKLLKPDGILCVNISNWHLTLEPFMRKVAEDFDVPMLGLQTGDDLANLAFGAKVAIFCRRPQGLAQPPFGQNCMPVDFSRFRSMKRLPTDENGSFLSLVNF